MPIITKRSFLTGFASLLAAPAVVRAASIMPVKAVDFDLLQATDREIELLKSRMEDVYRITRANMARLLYEQPPGGGCWFEGEKI
jgi:hypothetical protein